MLEHHFSTFKTTWFGYKHHRRVFITSNAHMVYLIRFETMYASLEEVSFHISTHLVSFTSGGPVSPEDTCSQVLRSCSVLRASIFPCLNFTEIVILSVYYTIPFGFTLS